MRFVPPKNRRDTCWVLTGYPALKMKLLCASQAAALGQGSLCNQAIMLITDGAMEDFQDVFEEFNWPERRVRHTNALADVPLAGTNQTAHFATLQPSLSCQVRVFTYLIGREMTFAENVKWIACNNKGGN